MNYLKIFILVFAPLLFGDELPAHLKLPNQGKNCHPVATFQDKKTDCGVTRYEHWECIYPAKNNFNVSSKKSFLIKGTYGTDSGNGCSPTYMPKEVIKQKD